MMRVILIKISPKERTYCLILRKKQKNSRPQLSSDYILLLFTSCRQTVFQSPRSSCRPNIALKTSRFALPVNRTYIFILELLGAVNWTFCVRVKGLWSQVWHCFDQNAKIGFILLSNRPCGLTSFKTSRV